MSSPTRTRLIVAALVVAATMVLAYTVARPADPVSREARRAAPAVPVVDVATVAAAPRLLFRHAAIDANYNHLSLAPLDAPNARRGDAARMRAPIGPGEAARLFLADAESPVIVR